MKNVKEMRDKVASALDKWRPDFWNIVYGIRGDADFDAVAHLEKHARDLYAIIKLAKEIEQA